MSILPSKKIVSIFILAAALVGSIIIAFGRDKSSQVINIANNLVAGDKVSLPENPNWQNELSGVNANADKVKTEGATSAGQTVTDTASISLMSNYLALKQSGKLDDASAQKLIDQTTNYIAENTSVPINKISASDLNIVADNGKQSIMDYGENLGTIAKIKSRAAIQNDFGIITQAIQSGDQSKLNELDGVITSYKNIVSKLVKTPVPKTFVKAHLDIVNSTNSMVSALTEMKSALSDPFKGLAALQLYQSSINTLSQATSATISFIKQNNIIYKQDSGGYYLLYEI